MKDKKEKGTFLKSLGKVWRGINFVRVLILNIVFFVLLFYLLSLLLGDSRPDVPDSTVLVVAPEGSIVEQLKPVGLPMCLLPMTIPVYQSSFHVSGCLLS